MQNLPYFTVIFFFFFWGGGGGLCMRGHYPSYDRYLVGGEE